MFTKILCLSILISTVGCTANTFNTKAPSTETQNPYHNLRNAAFSVKPAELHLDVGQHEPYGILMEFLIGDTPVTLLSFVTGDASLYFGSGGGVIGGIKHENVRAAAKTFIVEANKHTNQMSATGTFPAPTSGNVRFYILTPDNVLTVEANEQELVDRTSSLSPLFYAGQDVITQLRLTTENK